MIHDIRCEHLAQHGKVSAGNRCGKFSESREIFVLSHPHFSDVIDRALAGCSGFLILTQSGERPRAIRSVASLGDDAFRPLAAGVAECRPHHRRAAPSFWVRTPVPVDLVCGLFHQLGRFV